MDLHPYDGAERRFWHTDRDRTIGLDVIARLLPSIGSSPNDLRYDLSFYSGGIGIIDRLAIALPVNPTVWQSVIAKLKAKTIADANQDAEWVADLALLIWDIEEDDENEPSVVEYEAAIKFVNSERREFQTLCTTLDKIYFTDGSNVNGWCVLWGNDRYLNYLAYQQE
jgi:hypothetical protein